MTVQMPNLDEMWELIDQIKINATLVAKLDLKIKYMEAVVFREGKEKGMAISHIENAYKQTGFDDELIPLRMDYAEKKAELEALRYRLELLRDMIDVWRTVSANERLGLQ